MWSQCSFCRRGVEWWWRGAKRMSCSKVLNFLERLDDRIGCAHEEAVTVIKSWETVGGNKSFGCIFSEKSADWTNKLELEISSLTDLYDVFFQGQFWVKNEYGFLTESERGMLWQPRVIETGRELAAGFDEEKKEKRRASVSLSLSLSWFSVIHAFMSCVHLMLVLIQQTQDLLTMPPTDVNVS